MEDHGIRMTDSGKRLPRKATKDVGARGRRLAFMVNWGKTPAPTRLDTRPSPFGHWSRIQFAAVTSGREAKRSGLQDFVRCCACHLHHEPMNAPASIGQFFKTALQQAHHQLMSLLEMPTRQHTSATKESSTKICTILQLPFC